MSNTNVEVNTGRLNGGPGRLVRHVLLFGSAGLMLLALFMVFLWVPMDQTMGLSQRIFYFHVPLAWLGLLSILVVAFASAMHLITRKESWDSLAYATAELGVVLVTVLLITGILWAKPVWGVWWTWDVRLTTTAILWFIYIGYLMLRAYGPQGSQGARYGAVVALIGALDAPIIYTGTVWWRTIHPEMNIGPLAESGSLDWRMQFAMFTSLITFTVLYGYLLMERYSLRKAEVAVDELFHYA